jgi:hypothetical protein
MAGRLRGQVRPGPGEAGGERGPLYRRRGDQEGLALAFTYHGYVATLGRQPDFPVQEVFDKAMSLRPLHTDKLALASLLILAGLVEAEKGYLVAAIPPTEEALALVTEAGGEWGTKLCLLNVGLFTLVVGDLARSAELVRGMLHLARATDNEVPIQSGLLGLAHIAALWRATSSAARACGARRRPRARRRAWSCLRWRAR